MCEIASPKAMNFLSFFPRSHYDYIKGRKTTNENFPVPKEHE